MDHYASDVVGWHVAKKGDRWAALEPIRQGVRAHMGGFGKAIALGLGLRHDWGLQYRAKQFQAEIKWLGIRSTPAYVGEPECNGVAERFIRTLNALSQLQKAVADVEFIELRGRIKQMKVVAGELLWQKAAGFCVAIDDCERVEQEKVTVRVLQQGRGSKIYRGDFLMPVEGLLDESVLSHAVMPRRARRELLTMVEELRLGLSM